MNETERVSCPRCGESLPATLERCDACGTYLTMRAVPPASRVAGASPRAPEAPLAAPAASIAREPRGFKPRKGKRPDERKAHADVRPRAASSAVPGIAWFLLVVGMVVGGMVGFALRSAIGPRTGGEGVPTAQSPMDGGMGEGGGAMGGPGGAGAMPGGGGGMPPEVLRMIQSYKATLAQNPNDLDANIGMGNLEFDVGRWKSAIEYYTKALSVDPKNADVRVDRAIAYHGSGQDDVALQELARVTKEAPRHVNAWLNTGIISQAHGDRATAVRAYEQYLELQPHSPRSDEIRQRLAILKSAR